jgi:hypothetical protein
MNQSFYRKIAYLIALAALLWPMSWLGAPSTVDSSGGKLAQLRTESKLGQADLGAVDPASEAFRMATLGARGLAVTMLWNKANEYKKVEDWAAFRATLEQLAHLQPYFVKVWQYQAWNLTYNVSVEVDNYRDRFYYVKQGIDYLQKGISFLRDNPVLLDDLGWFCGNKVGRADEHFWYRQMFQFDDELHPDDRPSAERDNWLVSREWYELAISAVDDKKQPLGAKNPVTFFDSPARSQMSYAEAIQEEGKTPSRWGSAWKEGGRLWGEYAKRDIESTDGFLIRLGELDRWKDREQELRDDLEAISPGLPAKMRREAEDGLTEEQKKLLVKLPTEPTAEEMAQYDAANDALSITPAKIASRIAKDMPEQAAEARKIAILIDEANARVRAIDVNRDVANFEYWRLRCDIEQSPEALQARELLLEAKRLFKEEADPDGARKLYERSFVLWDKALKQFPGLTPDSTMGSDIMDFIDEYKAVLDQLDLSLEDEEVANEFVLWDILEHNDNEANYTEAREARKARLEGRTPGEDLPVDPAQSLIF